MSSAGSVTHWIHDLKAGDQAAVQKVWEGYFQRLVGLARKQLGGSPRGTADEEDVALTAFDSFCRRAGQGRFPELVDRHDLWQLLVLLTVRKARSQARREGAVKRGAGKVVNESALAGASQAEEGLGFRAFIGREPDPAVAALLAEEYKQRLAGLGVDERLVAQRKMEGYTNAEIAAEMGRSVPTVERKLNLIRKRLEKELEP